MNNQDPFSDVQDVLAETRGSLDCDAARDHERIKEKVNPATRAVEFSCTCQHCQRPLEVSIPALEELVPAMMTVVPRNVDNGAPWQVHNGIFYPSVYCPGCGNLVQIPITPDKANRLVQQLVKRGALGPHEVQAQIQQVQRLVPRR